LRGTPRPNTVDSTAILKWLRCNKIGPVQLSPEQQRMQMQFRRP
jgi:hypothetical protein